MINKVSIRWRLTILIMILLIISCFGLTLILNFAADKMVDKIDASVITPITISNENEIYPEDLVPSIPYTNIPSAKSGFRVESIAYMLLIVACGGLLTYYISGKALKPLHVLDNEVKHININNLSESLPVPNTNDEIADLTESFNQMTKKLNDAFMTQKRFSTNAAHELRTPLTVLQTKIDVFKKNTSHTPEQYDVLIEIFEKQIQKLRALVKSLLDMTNMDDDAEQSDIYLSDLLEDIIHELSPIAKDKNISLYSNYDNSVVHGNIDLLYRAFYNLIENGINYTIEGGCVYIDVKQTSKEKVSVIIKDTGIGIPDELKQHIFEPFYRVDASRSRAFGGAGIGLSIVDMVIKKHNGNIIVSDTETGGTCFNVIFKCR